LATKNTKSTKEKEDRKTEDTKITGNFGHLHHDERLPGMDKEGKLPPICRKVRDINSPRSKSSRHAKIPNVS